MVPQPCWVTLPCDATVKLRADLYNIGSRTNLTNPVSILVGNGKPTGVLESPSSLAPTRSASLTESPTIASNTRGHQNAHLPGPPQSVVPRSPSPGATCAYPIG